MPFPERNTEQDRFAYLYNGKELDEMTGLYYYGARYYDPRDGIFLGVDRFAENYPNLSPYHYGANNPIKYIDVNGDSLQLSFQKGTAQQFQGIVNEGLEGQFRVFFNDAVGDGQYNAFITPSDGGGDYEALTNEGKAFYNQMVDITTGEGVSKVRLVNNSSDVIIGRYNTGQIDIGDISKFNVGGKNIDKTQPVGATKQGKLIHELREQYAKTSFGYSGYNGFKYCHSIAIGAENSVNGNIRLEKQEKATKTGYIQRFKEKNGTISTVSYSTGYKPMNVTQPKPRGLLK